MSDIGAEFGTGETWMKSPGRIELTHNQVGELIEKVKRCDLPVEDREQLVDLIYALGWLNRSLEEKRLSIGRLQKIFGIQTEKASHILKTIEDEIQKDRENESGQAAVASGTKIKKAPGHGRRRSDEYQSARKVNYSHPTLKAGMRCPGCDRGKLCSLRSGKVLRIKAVAPLEATVHQAERLRCATCGEIYTADLPAEVGTDKYDASACSMVAVFRYGYGMPMNRLAHFQKSLGVPLGVGTQWELIERLIKTCDPVFDTLIQAAAQGERFHNDDTTMKILSAMAEQKQARNNGQALKRTGMFTTGIVAVAASRNIMLFFSGTKHAGENLDALLSRRKNMDDIPLQMCDALSRNEPSNHKTIVANCLTHGRRAFYDVYSAFPQQVKYVIGLLQGVYRYEAIAKKDRMSSDQRLRFHQEKSAPLMDELKDWLETQIVEKKVEPNSSLGKAIQYMRNHWNKLTRFLKVPGAPMTNDDCERLLKTAIRHRNNSLFYKNETGARAGDVLMSVIQTAIQAGVDPFLYLTALQKHESLVAKNPQQWLPWNYEETLKSLEKNEPLGSSP